MIVAILRRLAAGERLTRDEAEALAASFMEGEATDAQIGAALMLLAVRGETAEELAGLALAMRRRAVRIETRHARVVDTAGTGGDGANTFNISTAAAFVIAAADLPVAKHGNRAASSRSGSADVLAALGVRADLPPDVAARCLDELGICFLFAPLYHPATRRVAEVRRQLGVRTAFNLLGPLTNPAGARRQVIGVFDRSALERVAAAAAELGLERVWVVHGGGLDEMSVTAPTDVIEVREGSIAARMRVVPSELGLPAYDPAELRGGGPDENAVIVERVLSGEERGARRDVVLLNAAAGLVVGDAAGTLAEGMTIAAGAIDSGAALTLLERVRDFAEEVER